MATVFENYATDTEVDWHISQLDYLARVALAHLVDKLRQRAFGVHTDSLFIQYLTSEVCEGNRRGAARTT